MTLGVMVGSKPRLKFDSNLNLVFDGNSLIAGVGGQDIPRITAKTAPLSVASHPVSQSYDATLLVNNAAYIKRQTDKGIIVLNLAVSGQTWQNMDGLGGSGQTSADVDGAWVSGKTNVLVLWEGTNSIYPSLGNRTPAQAIQDATTYINNRQAAALAKGGKWIILIGTCIPRENPASESATITLNGNLDTYNNLIRSTYKAMGAHGVFDVRQAGSVFNLPDYTYSSFEAFNTNVGYWSTGFDSANGHTHLNTNGYYYVVTNFIVPALKRLPPR